MMWLEILLDVLQVAGLAWLILGSRPDRGSSMTPSGTASLTRLERKARGHPGRDRLRRWIAEKQAGLARHGD